MQSAEISDEQRETFERDGVICLRGLIEPGWFDALRLAVEEINATPTELSRNLAAEGGESGIFFQEINVSRRNNLLSRFLHDSTIAAAAARIMNSRSVRFFSDQLLVKEPGTSAQTPWHQDFPYFPCDGQQICSVWLGLDVVTRENGAMSFVRGSHRTGKLYAPRNFASQSAYDADPFDGPAPDVDAHPEIFETVCYEMRPGDVTIHHARTLHGAKGNSSNTVRRRGYTVRFAGDDIRWRNRRYMPRGFDSLADGAPLSGPRYPVLFQESNVSITAPA
jgi:ectoine hydroxylase-related dioxygenase (phytanoyl-CoA dioxygenase family)